MPVYSLYSETREPTAEMLRGLDVLVIDLQDVGTRIYTYVTRWPTACACRRERRCRSSCATGRIRSAASRSKAPLLDARFASFVGQFPIPIRHGMTIGELARLFNEHSASAPARSRRDGGLAPREYFDQTGLPG